MNPFALFLDKLTLAFDLPVLEWVRANLQCRFLDTVMPVITKLTDAGIIWIAIAFALIVLFRKYTRMGAGMIFALVMGLLVCNAFLKPLVARIRPYDYQMLNFGREIALLIPPETDFSFPSGHTIACFEACTVMLLRDKRLGIPALVLAVLTAFSRIYLYVHFPSDVIVSVILGIPIGFAANALTEALFSRRIKRKMQKEA